MPARTGRLRIQADYALGLLIGVASIGFLAADVATPSLFREPFPAMIVLGIVTAQLTVICVWGTLVRGAFCVRLPWTLLLLVISWCAFAWGIAIEKGTNDIDAMLGVGMVWMFGFVTSFLPLKFAAVCFGWQIVQFSSDPNEPTRSRYAIRDIMIGTLLLALTMAIARAMLPGEQISFVRAWRACSLNEPELIIAISLYGIVSLLVKLPCIWISLGAGSEKIMGYIGVWTVYCFAVAIVEVGIFVAILGPGGGDVPELFVGIVLSHQLMGGIMLAVCLALRGLGYRLQSSLKGTQEVANASG